MVLLNGFCMLWTKCRHPNAKTTTENYLHRELAVNVCCFQNTVIFNTLSYCHLAIMVYSVPQPLSEKLLFYVFDLRGLTKSYSLLHLVYLNLCEV